MGSYKIERLNVFILKISNKKSIAQLLILIIVVSLIAVIIVKRKTINLVINGKKSTIITYKDTVGTILARNDVLVDSKDKITPELNSKVSNNSTILIKRAVTVKLSVDGKNVTIKTSENTIDDLLKIEGIKLNNKDKVQPLKETVIVKDMKVNVVRMEVKAITESKDIPFDTVTQKDSSLPNSVKKTTQEGKTGQKTITTNVEYENGTEISRTIVKETIDRQPVNTIISQGTLVVVIKPSVKKLAAPVVIKPIKIPIAAVSRGGNTSPTYNKVITARATAYEPTHGLSAFTSSGRKAVRDPNGYSTIAVDPSVIPIGSKVLVEGYGLAYAADTGSAVKGAKIDVFFNTLMEARNWGVRNVKVYVLK